MEIDEASELIRRYYLAYRAGTADDVARALAQVLAPSFTIDSPLVRERSGGPVSGEFALAFAQAAAPALRHAEIEDLYFSIDGTAAVALIQFPIPDATLWQSEHFELAAGVITSLRSFYDPRALLGPMREDGSARV